jgi:transposase-like protein
MSSRKPYTREFKLQAMNLVRDKGYSISLAARELNMPLNTLAQWLNKAGWKSEPQQLVEPSSDVPVLQTQLKAANAQIKRLEMEKEILKKATAYFASQSL